MTKTIKVIEMFAGVGGFRLGLEGQSNKSPSSGYKKQYNSPYQVIWSNQYEPGKIKQIASLIYEDRFGKEGHSNQDITKVPIKSIPKSDLLVAGFPCQDYSVANTLKNAKGLEGAKGNLWWSIYNILKDKKKSPDYILLENVDRIVKSPKNQRGKDFAVILKCLDIAGYTVEWRILRASDYGMPQKRTRIFIIGAKKTTKLGKEMLKNQDLEYIMSKSVLGQAFPCTANTKELLIEPQISLCDSLDQISKTFNTINTKGIFKGAGIMSNGIVTSTNVIPKYDGKTQTLGEILEKSRVSQEFEIDPDELEKWKFLKGAKKIKRKSKDGFEYDYSEGAMLFPDPLDKPSRTIITSEGGKSASRHKHIVKTKGVYRRLTPIELERLNMFPDNHTMHEKTTPQERAFLMGNALVVGVIEKIGISLSNKLS